MPHRHFRFILLAGVSIDDFAVVGFPNDYEYHYFLRAVQGRHTATYTPLSYVDAYKLLLGSEGVGYGCYIPTGDPDVDLDRTRQCLTKMIVLMQSFHMPHKLDPVCLFINPTDVGDLNEAVSETTTGNS